MANLQFPFAELYYAEIWAFLLARKGVLLPEHSEQEPEDPINQLLQAQALGHHQLACLLDHAALESLWSTARLRTSMLPWARLIGYTMAPPSPAEAEVLADVNGAVSGTLVVWAAGSLVATQQTAETAAVLYELDAPVSVTDLGTLVVRADDGAITTPTFPWTAFTGDFDAGDLLYIGHPDAMWQRHVMSVSTVGSQAVVLAWEYRDDRRVLLPTSVTNLGATIELDVHELLTGGQGRSMAGAEVVVTCTSTGISETCTAAWDGTTHTVTTSDALGQGVISTNRGDYTIQADWVMLPGLSDGTQTGAATGPSLQRSGSVSWTLPDGLDRRWAQEEVDGVTAFWVRARVISGTGSTSTAYVLGEPDEDLSTTWTVRALVRQGEPVDERLGVSDGEADQVFTLSQEPVMEVTGVTVDGVSWEVVDSFLSALPSDLVARYREEQDGSHTLTFGDGARGQVPVLGEEIRVQYRVGGGDDGNVAAGAIRIDRSGNSRLRNLRNPLGLTGWTVLEGSTAEDLELLRDRLPAHLASLERAVAPDDYEALAQGFRTADGSPLASRAVAIEEGAGLQTVEVACVGVGGAVPTVADLAELEAYFNGTDLGVERDGGVVPGNTRAVCTAYTPQPVDVTVVVTVYTGFGATAEAAATAALVAALSPLARRLERDADGRVYEGTAYQWRMAGQVQRALLSARIAFAVPGFVDASFAVPTGNVTLGSRALPTPGTILVSVVEI